MASSLVSITPECCICLGSLKTSKVLPCGHTFCFDCLDKLIFKKTEKFPCPTCQQDVKIPKGGAEKFPTNYILQTSRHKTQVTDRPPQTTQPEHTSTIQPKCPNHHGREVDYYCNNCNVLLCSKCIIKQHKDHETLEIECDESRDKAIEKLESSQKIVKDKIKNMVQARSALLDSFKHMESFCEDSCNKVIETTERIVSLLRTGSKQILKDIKLNLEENRSTVEEREMKITSEINSLESDTEFNISPSTEITLNILLALIKINELDKSGTDYNLCLPYLQWVEKEFHLDQLGSVKSLSYYIPASYQFIFNVSDIEKLHTRSYSKSKFRNNNLVWSCGVEWFKVGSLGVGIALMSHDNPKLHSCIYDVKISLLNINDDSKTVTINNSKKRLDRGGWKNYWQHPITWPDLIDMDNGFLNSNDQFIFQCDIKIREIEFQSVE